MILKPDHEITQFRLLLIRRRDFFGRLFADAFDLFELTRIMFENFEGLLPERRNDTFRRCRSYSVNDT